MRLPGRIAAAIAVLEQVEARHRPVSEALKDWGNANRFAGAGDRAAIGNLVYDALRKRASHAWAMQSDVPRALVLSVAVRDWGEDAIALSASFAGDRFAPAELSEDEIARLTSSDPLADAPDHVRADVPEWLVPGLQEGLGVEWVAEAASMTGRPPLDLRANTLKSDRDRVLKSLKRFEPEPTELAPHGVRMPAGERDARTPNVTTDEGYLKGWFEVQDQGSQLVSALVDAHPGEQVLDFCAGGGGKTLALAAAMGNKGQIFAHDSDRTRLAPIYDRLKRNGVRNAQVRPPEPDGLNDLLGRMNRVVVDAPCTGTGTWRRRPDTKWKLSAEQLAQRCREQASILDDAARYVGPSGSLIYITCSILGDENGKQIAAFCARHPEFAVVPGQEQWAQQFFAATRSPLFDAAGGLTLTPLRTGTDGFYFAKLRRE